MTMTWRGVRIRLLVAILYVYDLAWLVGQKSLPVMMVAYMAASQFVITYQIGYKSMVMASGVGRPNSDVGFAPPGDWTNPAMYNIGLTIMVVEAMSAFSYLAPLTVFYATFWYHVYVRPWKAHLAMKGIMQGSDPSDLRNLGYHYGMGDVAYGWNRGRPRVCGTCHAQQSDRVYHCSRLGICLPLYNHFCPALRAPVFLHNMRHYLFFLWAISWNCLLSIGISAWALGQDQRWDQMIAGPIWVILLSLVPISYAGYIFWDKFRHLALRNLVAAEIAHIPGRLAPRGVWLVVRHVTFAVTLQWVWVERNPWDLGVWANLEQSLGSCGGMSPVLWLFVPLWFPERVYRYGRYHGDVGDLGDLPWGLDGIRVRNQVLLPGWGGTLPFGRLRSRRGRGSGSGSTAHSTAFEV